MEKPLSKKVSIAEGITAAREHLRLIEVSLCDGLFAAAKVNDLVPAFREETQNLERFSERLADTQWWLRKRVEGWRDQAAKKRGCLREASGWEI